jgi:hypothetical protein
MSTQFQKGQLVTILDKKTKSPKKIKGKDFFYGYRNSLGENLRVPAKFLVYYFDAICDRDPSKAWVRQKGVTYSSGRLVDFRPSFPLLVPVSDLAEAVL